MFPAPLPAFPLEELPLNFLSGTVGPRITGDSAAACSADGPSTKSALAATYIKYIKKPVSRTETQAVPSGSAIITNLNNKPPPKTTK